MGTTFICDHDDHQSGGAWPGMSYTNVPQSTLCGCACRHVCPQFCVNKEKLDQVLR